MLRKTVSIVSFLAATSLPAFAQAPAESSASFSDAQKTEIQKIVREYLVKNPEVLVDVSKALQEKQTAEMENQAKDAVAANEKVLFSSKNSPAIGSEKPDVTIVEFFDYQCVHCKHMVDVVDQITKNNKNLRVVFKQFPIFGQDSENAARAALAAQFQNKFFEFHNAMMKHEGRLNSDAVMKIAKSVGLDVKKLKADMSKPEVAQELRETMQLARNMKLMGTPAFIVSATPFKKEKEYFFIPGSSSVEKLQSFIDKTKSS